MKKGISLIVLVITIIVIIILAGTVILSLANNNPITQATEASFKSSLDSYNSELSMFISKKYVENPNLDAKTLNATIWDGSATITGTVKEYISNITVEDGKKYVISGGKLFYIANESDKKQWAKNLGVTDGTLVHLSGKDFKNSPQTVSLSDISGNGNNAVPYGFGYTASSGSDGSNAIVFDGVDDYLSINSLGINGANCSISMVVYFTNTQNQIWFASNSGVGIGLFNTNTIILRAGDVTKSKRIANISGLNINQWNHIVVNYDINGNPTAYFNGTPATYTADLNYWIHQVPQSYIGCRNNVTNSYFFNGKIKDVCVYNRILTLDEIQQSYTASL